MTLVGVSPLMSIGTKIILAYAVAVVFTIAVSSLSIVRSRALNEGVRQLAARSLPGIDAAGRLAGIAKDMRGGIRGHITAADAEAKKKAEKDLAQLEHTCQTELGEYEKTITGPRERELFDQVPEALNGIAHTTGAIFSLSRNGQTEKAMGLFRSQTMPAYANAQKAIESLAKFKLQDGDRMVAEATGLALGLQAWTWSLLTLSLAVAAGVGRYLSTQINGVLLPAVESLSAASSELKSATAQIDQSSILLARNTTDQAASLEETSASSLEIHAMAARNAEISKRASHDMHETARRLEASNEAVQGMVSSMEGIHTSSHEILKIIAVIDGIAFQTKILALNAAVEAARAGQSGLSFAVVADEVRTLAQRTAQAARDTAILIEDSVSKSSAGKGQLDEIAQSIRSVVESAGRVTGLMQEVEAGSDEQARGIQRVSTSVAQMQQVTQNTAAMAEEGASAACQLNAQSEVLRQTVTSLITLVRARELTGEPEKGHATRRKLQGSVV